MKNLVLDEIKGAATRKVSLAASVVINALSGKFLTMDGSGNFALSLAADTQIAGWTSQTGSFSASAAADFATLDIDPLKIYEMPASSAITESAMKLLYLKTCDIAIYSSGATIIQQANVTASSTDVLVICGWDIAAQTVYVRMNPLKQTVAGVA